MARPKKDIDPETVRKLAAIECSYAEIAAVLGCDPSTLTRRFAQVIEKGREEGKASLKRKQFEVAMGGNPTMLIWLGKQRLGQKDEQSLRHSNPDGSALAPAQVNVTLVNARGAAESDAVVPTGGRFSS